MCYDVPMKRAGGRELRQKAAQGPSGLTELKRRGLLRGAEGDLLDVVPVRMPKGRRRPSDLVNEGRRRR